MEMTKFIGVDDPGFLAVSGELRRWVKEIATDKHDKGVSQNKSLGKEGLEDEYVSPGENCNKFLQKECAPTHTTHSPPRRRCSVLRHGRHGEHHCHPSSNIRGIARDAKGKNSGCLRIQRTY